MSVSLGVLSVVLALGGCNINPTNSTREISPDCQYFKPIYDGFWNAVEESTINEAWAGESVSVRRIKEDGIPSVWLETYRQLPLVEDGTLEYILQEMINSNRQPVKDWQRLWYGHFESGMSYCALPNADLRYGK